MPFSSLQHINLSLIHFSIIIIMAGTTVALSGVFNVQLPSIRSLNLHLDLEGRRHNYAPYAPRIPSQEPAVVLHDINQYPLYPLHGDRRFPDPSQNVGASFIQNIF